jgi:hypothetical protein
MWDRHSIGRVLRRTARVTIIVAGIIAGGFGAINLELWVIDHFQLFAVKPRPGTIEYGKYVFWFFFLIVIPGCAAAGEFLAAVLTKEITLRSDRDSKTTALPSA